MGGNGSVTTADHTYWFIYDDRWRIIATYRCEWDGGASKYLPDTEHKEQLVWHNAGMDGRGGSSYIDCVILRDRDNSSGWLAASDGVLEERRFFGQNWRADVSLVMNTNGRPLERIKYSAYGTPITLTDIDYNNDTSLDPDDPGDFVNAPYDWNLDGATDGGDNTDFAADYFTVAGNSYGRGVLSLAGIDNRIGYAGYIYDRFISGSDGGKWFVRYRVLNSGLGSWQTRDPLGNVDGMGLYEYAISNPIGETDPTGECTGAILCPPVPLPSIPPLALPGWICVSNPVTLSICCFAVLAPTTVYCATVARTPTQGQTSCTDLMHSCLQALVASGCRTPGRGFSCDEPPRLSCTQLRGKILQALDCLSARHAVQKYCYGDRWDDPGHNLAYRNALTALNKCIEKFITRKCWNRSGIPLNRRDVQREIGSRSRSAYRLCQATDPASGPR